MSDIQQRELALDAQQSFIVQAPAGSGKTELLTQRYLRLLAVVEQPEEILAITFTKKAAAEMRSRIRDALLRVAQGQIPQSAHQQKTWQLAQQALIQDKKLNWQLLNHPNRLRIKTIDSFNVLLTKQLPLLSLFGAPPEIVHQPTILYQTAVTILLTHLEENVAWSDALAKLLLHLDNDMQKLQRLLIDLLGSRDQWLPYILAHHHQPDLRKALENHLTDVIEESLHHLQQSFPADCVDELLALLHFAQQNLVAAGRLDPSLVYQRKQLPNATANDKHTWLQIANLLLTKQAESWRKRIDKSIGFPAPSTAKGVEKVRLQEYQSRLKILIEQLSLNEPLHQAFIALHQLPAAHYEDNQWEVLQALHEVLKITVAQLKVVFQQQDKIDYVENAQAALTALGDEDSPTDIALSLDYQIKHILIDEFQDTSHVQFRLIEKLVAGWQQDDKRTLFLVGDPMQSIYRFRQAEVGLFIRARQQGIAGVKLQPLTLSSNFRSQSAIVDWINHKFANIMPHYDNMALGAVSYTPCYPQDKQTGEGVKCHTFVNANPEKQVQKIIQLIQQKTINAPDETIAILVRSRNQLTQLIPAMKQAKLAYQAVDIDPLLTRPVIQDLLALTKAILYPADRIAWLSILRAPWSGLSLADLKQIAGNNKQEIIWLRLLEINYANLSADGKKRLQRIQPILQQMMQERQREPLHNLVKNTWLALGGAACVQQVSDLPDAQRYFDLIKYIAQQSSIFNWNLLQSAIQQLYAQSDCQIESNIKIMTIHNAKGLEFDTVILPHLESKSPPKDKPLLTWLERPLLKNNTSALLLAPIHAAHDKEDSISAHIRLQDKQKSQYENSRLLYVAVTRAKKALHLLMNIEMKDNQVRNLSGSLLENSWSIIANEAIIEEQPTLSVVQTMHSPVPSNLRRLKAEWEFAYSRISTDRPNDNTIREFDLSTKQPQQIGVIVHYILQQLARYGLMWWMGKSQQIIGNMIVSQYKQRGWLPPSAEGLHKIHLAVQQTLADEKGQWILTRHEQAQAEYALTAWIRGKWKNLIIDRTFIHEGYRWIIDYKTTDETEINFSHYHQQLLDYKQAFSAIDNHPIRLGLYFPLIPAWQEITEQTIILRES